MLAAALLAGDDIGELIGLLGSDDSPARSRATEALKRLGKRVEDPLRALQTDDLEVSLRRDQILAYVKDARESTVLVSWIRVDSESTRVLHEEPVEGRAEPGGFRAQLDGERRPRLYPWDRILRLGVRDGRDTYLCVRRERMWRPADPSVLEDVLRAEVARPFEIGAPDAFHLLARSSAFPRLIPAIVDRLNRSNDPVVREACERALEAQGRQP